MNVSCEFWIRHSAFARNFLQRKEIKCFAVYSSNQRQTHICEFNVDLQCGFIPNKARIVINFIGERRHTTISLRKVNE